MALTTAPICSRIVGCRVDGLPAVIEFLPCRHRSQNYFAVRNVTRGGTLNLV
jgi:hypothetical protein